MKATTFNQVTDQRRAGFSLRPLAAILVAGWSKAGNMNHFEDEDHRQKTVNRIQRLQQYYYEKYQAKCITNMGEGMMAAFPSACKAHECAREIQAGVEKLLASRLSIGIHMGEVTYLDQDVLGNTVTVAGALQEVALPGQILMSEAIALNSFSETESCGVYQLDGIRTPVIVYAASMKENSHELEVYVRDHGSKTISTQPEEVRKTLP